MIRTFYLYYILNALTGVIKKNIISNTKGFYFIQVLSDVRFLFFISSVLSLMMEYTWLNRKIQRNFPEDISYYIISAQKSGPRMLDSYTFKQRELSNVALTGNRDTFLFVFVIFFKVLNSRLSYLNPNNVHVL